MTLCTKLFSTLYYSGARKGELLALTWEDINFEEKQLTLIKQIIIDKLHNQKQKHPIELSCYHL